MANFTISLFYIFTIVLLIVSNLAHATPADSIRESGYGKQDVYVNDVERDSAYPLATMLPVPTVEAKETEQDKTSKATRNPEGQVESVASPESNQTITEPLVPISPSPTKEPPTEQFKPDLPNLCTWSKRRCLRKWRCYRYVLRRWGRRRYYRTYWNYSRFCRGRCRVKAGSCNRYHFWFFRGET